MIEFVLNNKSIKTELSGGKTVLDFVRYRKNLKGTKIGCREGDCGACTILIGELVDENVKYRSMTSCLMPLANAAGKHIVTVEGINPEDGEMTPVQSAIVENGGTQCGFCTVGFVMSLTGFWVDKCPKTADQAISAIDGNICRCTGYKSLERAAEDLCDFAPSGVAESSRISSAIVNGVIPEYFDGIADRLHEINESVPDARAKRAVIVGGGTDLYVQRPEDMVDMEASHVFYSKELRGIRKINGHIEIGASSTVSDLLESSLMRGIFPKLYDHLKLVSSTPIRNMATLAGNFVNASPIGDMTVWFLALNAELVFDSGRTLPLRKFYKGYKDIAKSDDESVKIIRFSLPDENFRFNFEKVCKRQYLDIATVNTAVSFTYVDGQIKNAHLAAGGVAPVPLYLEETSDYLNDQEFGPETVVRALELIESEISPISDVRGSEAYKRLLMRQLFKGHFFEIFGIQGKFLEDN